MAELVMGDAVRDRDTPPDVLVQINVELAPERHVAFLNTLAELLATRVLNDLAPGQTHDRDDSSTT